LLSRKEDGERLVATPDEQNQTSADDNSDVHCRYITNTLNSKSSDQSRQIACFVSNLTDSLIYPFKLYLKYSFDLLGSLWILVGKCM